MTRRHSISEVRPPLSAVWQEASCLTPYALYPSRFTYIRRSKLRRLIGFARNLVSLEEVYGAGLLERLNQRYEQDGRAMSLCWLMQSDFLHGTGQFDDRGAKLYTRYDLEFGLHYAQDYLNAGETKEPLYGYDLVKFRDWILAKLKKEPR